MNNELIFLYVEDDPKSCTIMEFLLLRALGYKHLTIFADTHNFISRVSQLNPIPNVIFLDIHIQPLSGFEVLKLLREEPRFAQSKILALTASVMSEEIDALKASGFDGAIAKPLDPDVFPQLIKQISEGKTVWYI